MDRAAIEKLVVSQDYKGPLDGLISHNNWQIIEKVLSGHPFALGLP